MCADRVIPQAVCARYGLSIGARCAPFVLMLMYALGMIEYVQVLHNIIMTPRFSIAPVAWPIAKLLDHILGSSEAHTYKKAELKSFLQVSLFFLKKKSTYDFKHKHSGCLIHSSTATVQSH